MAARCRAKLRRDICEGEGELNGDEEDVEDADKEQYLEAIPPCPPH